MTNKKEKSFVSPVSAFHLEADRCTEGIKMFVSGVIGIGGYSAEEILLRSHACRLRLWGKRLKICVYENNTVEVRGRLEGIEFIYGKG